MIWTFGKGKDRISLGRRVESCVLVVVRGRDHITEYSFADEPALRAFQGDMETFLRKTGWNLLKFFPERRLRKRDSRRTPQLGERRKWWSQSRERDKAVWGGKAARV